jgi:ribonuclease BN (tRNA processing enzyme)
MGSGIEIDVVGDSSLFTALGKGVAYLVRANGSQYMIDSGATPFLALGHAGIMGLRGLFATHSHEDHRRWFTDIVLYMHYQPPAVARRLNLITSEDIHEEYEKNSKGALERSLSADSRKIVDVPFDQFVQKIVLGPRAKYRIEPRNLDSGGGRVWRVVEVATGRILTPDRAKVFVNPKANRPRLLFKDPEIGEWVEPQSFYPFASTVFYESDRNDFRDPDSGLCFRAAKAAAWHGPPTIGIVVSLGDDRVAFSSDTVYDPPLWLDLVETRNKLPKDVRTKAWQEAYVVEDDINAYIERSWGRARYDEAMTCYDGAVVIHDADFERSVVHTAQSKFSPDSDWLRLILTHTPDGFASVHPITLTGKKFRVLSGEVYENVDGDSWPLDADLYFKDKSGTLWVGYKNDSGTGRLWDTPRGLAVEMSGKPSVAATDAKFLGRYDLYVDMAGVYVPEPSSSNQAYRLRSDGKVELVTQTPTGSTGTVVENVRGKLSRKL